LINKEHKTDVYDIELSYQIVWNLVKDISGPHVDVRWEPLFEGSLRKVDIHPIQAKVYRCLPIKT